MDVNRFKSEFNRGADFFADMSAKSGCCKWDSYRADLLQRARDQIAQEAVDEEGYSENALLSAIERVSDSLAKKGPYREIVAQWLNTLNKFARKRADQDKMKDINPTDHFKMAAKLYYKMNKKTSCCKWEAVRKPLFEEAIQAFKSADGAITVASAAEQASDIRATKKAKEKGWEKSVIQGGYKQKAETWLNGIQAFAEQSAEIDRRACAL